MMLYIERSVCDAPSEGPLGKALSATTACRSSLSIPVGGASSHIPLHSLFYHKLSVCRPGLGALPSRDFTQEQLGQTEPVNKNSASKKEDSGLDLCKRSYGNLKLSKAGDDVEESHTLANDQQESTLAISQAAHLRLDALDMEKDFRRRRVRPRLDLDSPIPKIHARPGKRQDITPKARRMILELRELPLEDFELALKRFTFYNPDRADWLYVLRFFKEKENKSMLIQVFNFVLLEQAFMASARDYTNFIVVHVQLKNHEAVEHILKAMVEKGILPDLVTFTVVIGMYGRLRNIDMVNEKFDELKVWGLMPDTPVYCALIEAYSQFGRAREAEMFLRDMELADLPLKIEIYISLIRGYGIIGQVQDAERVFQLMQAKLFYPERRSYSALMDAYSKDEDPTRAIQVFDNMLLVGIEPTDKSLARLLIACENRNMLKEATEIIAKIESKCFKFGTKALATFNGWLQKIGLGGTEAKLVSSEVERRLRRKAYLEKKLGTGAYVPESFKSQGSLLNC